MRKSGAKSKIILSIILSGILFLPTQKSFAAVPTFDIGLNPKEVGMSLSGIPLVGDLFNRFMPGGGKIGNVQIPGTSWDHAAWIFAKWILRGITDSIVRWIKGGGGGANFIQNFERYLTGAADNAAGILLEEVLGTGQARKLCQPFRIRIREDIFGIYDEFGIDHAVIQNEGRLEDTTEMAKNAIKEALEAHG